MILEDLMLELMYHLPMQAEGPRLCGDGGNGARTRN